MPCFSLQMNAWVSFFMASSLLWDLWDWHSLLRSCVFWGALFLLLSRNVCSWASEKRGDCLIQLDRKENNKQCKANIASKRLVVEEIEKWKQGGGEILHMYRMKKSCLRWAWAWQVTPECRSHRPAAELICSGFGTWYDTCMSLFSVCSEKSWLKMGAILLELEQ